VLLTADDLFVVRQTDRQAEPVNINIITLLLSLFPSILERNKNNSLVVVFFSCGMTRFGLSSVCMIEELESESSCQGDALSLICECATDWLTNEMPEFWRVVM